MEAWINSSTGADESPPEGAPSADPAADQITPPPEPTLAASDVAATPPPEAAVPTPQPLTMVSGVIEAPATALPLVTIIPAPEPAAVVEAPRTTATVPTVVVSAPAATAPARPAHAGDDSAFEDQITNWMKQGDRLADPRPVENLDLSDLAEPTDPVAHELLDSRKQVARPAARAGRWISIGALGVAMSFGLYWAAQEPRPGAVAATAAPTVASVADLAPVLGPAAQGPAATAPAPAAPAPATQIAAAETPSAAANAARGRHKHHRGAGRVHRRHGQ